MNDNAHEVSLGGGDCADGLGLGKRRGILGGEHWGERGRVVPEDFFGSEQVLARLGLLGHLISVFLLFGGDREASDGRQAPQEEAVYGWVIRRGVSDD